MAHDHADASAADAAGRVLSSRWRTILAICAVVALTWMIAARVFGPSDLWDQTQPKTVSYTTDIIVNGRWVLPVERGEYPATKPPLYNWLAAPAVWTMGFDSEIAHKLPSMAALFVCWAGLILLGRRMLPEHGGAVGYLAAMAFVSGYTIFKLGYLARPDMVLTAWLFLGWVVGTKLLMGIAESPRRSASSRFLLTLAFWVCVGLAGLTKGPAAIVLPAFLIIGGKVLTGRWRAGFQLGWWWGVPLSLAMVGLWVWGVWLVDPEHLKTELWYNEIWGRITGTGPEGSKEGLTGWLKGLAHMPLYYVARSAPWSVLSIMGMVELVRKDPRPGQSGRIWRSTGSGGYWMMSAMLMALVVVGLFTLSSSKRADYIAPAFAPGALLAGWWLMRARPRLGLHLPWVGPLACIISLATMTLVNQQDPAAPERGFGDQIMVFARQARAAIEEDPAPIVFWNAGATHLQAMLGASEKDVGTLFHGRSEDGTQPGESAGAPDGTSPGDEFLYRLVLGKGHPFWLVEGRPAPGQSSFLESCAGRGLAVRAPVLAESADLPRTNDWPEQVTLRRIEPSMGD